MEIKTVVVAGGPMSSLVFLTTSKADSHSLFELPIKIGSYEAYAISTGVSSPDNLRPKTHDLLLNALEKLGATLDSVAIVDMKDTTFYAHLILKTQDGRPLHIDCRPSDAIACAVRAHVPIYAEESVLQTASLPNFSEIEQEEKAQKIEEFHNFVEAVSPDDFKKNNT